MKNLTDVTITASINILTYNHKRENSGCPQKDKSKPVLVAGRIQS